MNRALLAIGAAASLLVGPAMAQKAEAPKWSAWMSKRGHFQFQMRAEQVSAGVMRIHMRVRPDVAKIAAEPRYANERYYLEYFQNIDSTSTGGAGSLTETSPRRIMFPANAPETCVFEENDLYAIIQPPGQDVRLYLDPAVTPLPILEQNGEKLSGFEMVVGFTVNYGAEDVVRKSGAGPRLENFKLAC